MSKLQPTKKKSGATILLATAVSIALIFGLATNPLKLRVKPPHWKIVGERYGVSTQFRFGKSRGNIGFDVMASKSLVTVEQRNNFGPFFYSRYLQTTNYPAWLDNGQPNGRDIVIKKIFAELK